MSNNEYGIKSFVQIITRMLNLEGIKLVMTTILIWRWTDKECFIIILLSTKCKRIQMSYIGGYEMKKKWLKEVVKSRLYFINFYANGSYSSL